MAYPDFNPQSGGRGFEPGPYEDFDMPTRDYEGGKDEDPRSEYSKGHDEGYGKGIIDGIRLMMKAMLSDE